MTTQGRKKPVSTWRRTSTTALAGTGVLVVLLLGSTPATARADVVDDLAKEFSTAAGGGQIPSLVNQTLKLRAMGFLPTKGQLDGITHAETYRPNQTPLIKALQETVAAQTRLQQQAQALQGGQNQVGFGINQYDPTSPGGLTAGPGGVNVGGGSNQFTIGDGRAGSVPGGG
ncbi:MAG: Uncharacterized protein JWR32_5346 [Mycobacterium sp.]|jgi:hypothetical protein|nr:Uncharacterized protein [Mycobacterium sp.]